MAHKTFSLKGGDVNHNWVLIDASAAPLGRVATFIANRLSGKYKPTFTPSMDDGDYVVVINTDKIIVTGDKEEDKEYHHYSGFPSGMTTRTLKEVRERNSGAIISAAVKGMLPKNKLSAERMKRLRVFPGAEHGHVAQKPVTLEIK
jgi:large subunit ribosomal protein L13